MAAQIFVVFLIGAALAAAANYCADRFAWTPRYRSPWRRFPENLTNEDAAPRRNWATKIPIFGWLVLAGLRENGPNVRKTAKNGKVDAKSKRFSAIPGWESGAFWVRPFFVELLFAAFLSWRFAETVGVAVSSEVGRALVFWGAETILFWLALCATLVDFDDYIIPDEIVVPGAVVGLMLAAAFPFLTFYPVRWPLDPSGAAATTDVFQFAARLCPALGLDASPSSIRVLVFSGLAAIWTFWAFALLDRRWYWRLGWRRAAAIFARRLRRAPSTKFFAALWTLGLVGIGALVANEPTETLETAAKIGAANLAEIVNPGNLSVSDNLGGGVFLDVPLSAVGGLTNALIGLFVGTALIWAVRLVGGGALGVEAMGFGDVILTGAIGAFVGWEGVVVVFFVAPFFGLFFGILRRFFNDAPEIPYGPFLCAGTVVYVVWRERFHEFLAPFFNDPFFVAILGTVGFVLLAAMLLGLRAVKSWARG